MSNLSFWTRQGREEVTDIHESQFEFDKVIFENCA